VAIGRRLSFRFGSVGRLRDGDPSAGYILLAVEVELQVEFRRVAWDVAAAVNATRSRWLIS